MKEFFSRVLFVLFFVHGIIYYFFPLDLYNSESPLKLIKYGILFFFIIINFKDISNTLLFLIISLFLFFFLFTFHDFSEVSYLSLFNRLIVYLAPLSIILVSRVLDKMRLKFEIYFIILTSVVTTFLEFFILRGIFANYNFSESEGFIRTASIFINPNNAGLVLTFALIYLFLMKFESKYYLEILRFISLGVILFAITLTGSKTPFFLIAVFLIILIANNIDGKLIFSFRYKPAIVLIGMLSILVIFFYLTFDANNEKDFREFSMETGNIRIEQITNFFKHLSIDNFISPDYYRFGVTYDVSFLQIWSDLGLLGVIIFYSFLLFILGNSIAKKKKEKLIVLMIIFASSFSLNVFYLWPPAYIFWYFIFQKKELSKIRQ